jgi:predicted esterase
MSDLSFAQISKIMQQHFTLKSFKEGLVLANKALTFYPQHFPLINYWRICLAAQMNDFEQANHFLEETLAAGTWYAQAVLRGNPALELIQGNPEFERLAGISEQMQKLDPKEHTPILVLRQKGSCRHGELPGCPLLIFLHGNQETAHFHLKHWHSLSNTGWLVALPQSSSALWADAHAWMDHSSAIDEVEQQYIQLNKQYEINHDQIIVTGFAMGAEVALALALSGRIHCQGFILLAPAGPLTGDLRDWQPYFKQCKEKTLRGVIIMGEEDENILPDHIKQLSDLLKQQGITTKLHTFPNLKHEYPRNFEQVLQKAIKFIIG